MSNFSIEVGSLRPYRKEGGEATQLETAIAILKKKYEREIKQDVKKHSEFNPRPTKRRKNKRGIPLLELSPLARLLLKKKADTLLGVGEETWSRTRTLSYDKRDDEDIVSTIVAARVIETGEYILTLDILKQLDPNMPRWSFPGGHREPGENLVMAAIREFKEEVGLDLDGVPLQRVGSIKLRKRAEDSEGEKRAAVFTAALPMTIVKRMRPGAEQKCLMLADDDLLLAMIEDRMILPNHVNVYRLIRNWHHNHH